jgi:two-component system, NarL family, sensor kinase
MSATTLVTSIISATGLLLNISIFILVITRGRKLYHYLFSGFLFICAFWDLGILLAMIRNSHINELSTYGYLIFWPCLFVPVIIYHFTSSYLNQPRKKLIIILWIVTLILFVLGVSGVIGKIDGVYNYSWGNIFKPDSLLKIGALASIPIWYFCTWSSCFYLFRAYKHEASKITKRHLLYLSVSFLVISLALVKTIILYNVDNPILLPLGMFLNDISASLIGIAIIKYQLLDITVIVKKATIYSSLTALIIFIFSLSEHFLATYVGEFFGEQSTYVHIISVAIVIGIVMPVRKKIELAIERFFEKKKVEF